MRSHCARVTSIRLHSCMCECDIAREHVFGWGRKAERLVNGHRRGEEGTHGSLRVGSQARLRIYTTLVDDISHLVIGTCIGNVTDR